MKVYNLTKNKVIAQQGAVAHTLVSRMRGLLGRKGMSPQEALVITKCKSIHMFFMRFAIDAIFIDKNNHVVGLVENIPPFRFSPLFPRAENAIELPPGTIDETKTSLGDVVRIEED